MLPSNFHGYSSLKREMKKYCTLVCVPLLMLLPNQAVADIAGKTILAKGEVKATNKDTLDVRRLRRRAEIFSVDHIITGTDSKAQFSMSDGGLISLKANTEIKISDYSFDKDTKQGSATLEVVSGGLRSISGLIKKSGGDYQVKTPVGSIGIRGTHFAVEVVEDNVVFGVFSGSIDVQLPNQQMLSLGANENFAFASVTPTGQVTLLTQAPPSIAAGLPSGSPSEESSDEESEEESDEESSDSTETAAMNTNSEQTVSVDYNVSGISTTFDASVYNESELLGVDGSSIAELIAKRTGTLTYHDVGNNNISSSQGEVTDFQMTMTIDFDKGSVPEGNISFTDQQGEWFAAYAGLINIDQLELGVHFASHDNNRADGNIAAAFSNGLDEITGAFSLFEIKNKQVSAGGSFKLKP